MPSPITFTFPDTAKLPAIVRGRTFSGGVPQNVPMNGKVERLVVFADTLIDGRPLSVRVEGRPNLAAAVVAYEAEATATAEAMREAARAALEAAIPGVHDLIALSETVEADRDGYDRAFRRMMDDGDNDGVRPPQPIKASLVQQLEAVRAANPRAAFYLRAKRQAESGSWADNTGAQAAGREAMAILATGGCLDDATIALAVRREWVD